MMFFAVRQLVVRHEIEQGEFKVHLKAGNVETNITFTAEWVNGYCDMSEEKRNEIRSTYPIGHQFTEYRLSEEGYQELQEILNDYDKLTNKLPALETRRLSHVRKIH